MRRNKQVIVLDGPPASGKSHIANDIRERQRLSNIKLVAFGFPTYHLASMINFLSLSPEVRSRAKTRRYHPISMISPSIIRKLHCLVLSLELVNRSLYFMKASLKLILSNGLIIDEGLVNVLSSYRQLSAQTGEPNLLECPRKLELTFFVRISKRYPTQFIFVDAANSVLMNRWRKRGHPLPLGTDGHNTRELNEWVSIIRQTFGDVVNSGMFPYISKDTTAVV